MKYKVEVSNIKTVDEIKGYWTEQDYRNLLDKYGVSDSEQIATEELREYLFMAISDFEPPEAANILMQYKLSDDLSDGQIDQLSHEMIEDKIAEEYPDINLHARLFHVNQLLFKAYNGTFPNIKASIIDLQIEAQRKEENAKIDKEIILKALQYGLKDSNIIKRLFEDHLAGEKAFESAEYILWELNPKGDNTYQIITSDYWLNKEDFALSEFEGEVVEFEEEED